jgi:hypothetical protein
MTITQPAMSWQEKRCEAAGHRQVLFVKHFAAPAVCAHVHGSVIDNVLADETMCW